MITPAPLPFRMAYGDERRWVLVLQQLELTRIALLRQTPR